MLRFAFDLELISNTHRSLVMTMSSNSELFLVQVDGEEGTQGEFLIKRPSSGSDEDKLRVSPSGHVESHSLQTPSQNDRPPSELQDGEKERQEADTVCICRRPSDECEAKSFGLGVEGEFIEEADGWDNDDGFRTPTSPDQRIPTPKQCPPAPRKLKSVPARKRKGLASSVASGEDDDHHRCTDIITGVDFSEEVESLLQPIVGDDDVQSGTKRTRREEEINGNK